MAHMIQEKMKPILTREKTPNFIQRPNWAKTCNLLWLLLFIWNS